MTRPTPNPPRPPGQGFNPKPGLIGGMDLNMPKNAGRQLRRTIASPCDRPPAAPTGVAVTYYILEARTHLRFRGKITWNDVTTDTSGLPINTVDRWDVRWRAVDAAGDPVETDNAGRTHFRTKLRNPVAKIALRAAEMDGTDFQFTTRGPNGFNVSQHVQITGCVPTDYNGTWTITATPDDNVFKVASGHGAGTVADATDVGKAIDADDHLHVHMHELQRPKTWYWQANVRCRSGEGCWSAWSGWTTKSLPWTGADPRPPAPTFGLTPITFDRKGQAPHRKLRLNFTFTEVVDWDVPGGDRESDVEAYVVQLDRSDDGSTWDGRPYVHKTVQAKDADSSDADDTATTRTVHFVAGIRREHWYRCRVRTVDRFGRKGDWSDWTAAALPFDDTAPPTPLNVQVSPATDQIIVDWDAPTADVPTRGTVSASSGGSTLTGVGTKFTIEVESGSDIKVGGETKIVKKVTSDTALSITDTWASDHSAVRLYLVEESPDVAYYVAQMAKAADVDTSTTPDDWSDVYKFYKGTHTHRRFKVTPGDEDVTFYFRVRAVDAGKNRSAWVAATLAGNSSTTASGEGVTVQRTRVVVSRNKTGDLSVEALDDKAWHVDGHYQILKVNATVGRHDAATHPADGTPNGAPAEIQWHRISADEGTTDFIVTDRVTVPINAHKGQATAADGFELDELFRGDVVYPRIAQVGSGTRPGTHLSTALVLRPLQDDPEEGPTTPGSIPDLALWWDFDYTALLWTGVGRLDHVLADGDLIGSVGNRAVPSTFVLEAEAAARPTWKDAIANGRAVARFDGAADVLTITDIVAGLFDGDPDLTLAMVLNPVDRTTRDVAPIFWGDSATTDAQFSLYQGPTFGGGAASKYSVTFGGAHNYNDSATIPAAFHVVTVTKAPGQISTTTDIYIDGVAGSDAGGSSTSTPNIGVGTGNGDLGAALIAPTNFYAGDIGEVLAWSRVLTGDELTVVWDYLKNKWGTA